MNKEYEVRLLNIDKENFIKILKDNQAEYIGKWVQNPILIIIAYFFRKIYRFYKIYGKKTNSP